MIGKSILYYKIFEKPGSPREIMTLLLATTSEIYISWGKSREINQRHAELVSASFLD